MMANRCAVIGIGQTKHTDKRLDVNHIGLVREACNRALEDARLPWKDIDALVIGKAPDTIEEMRLRGQAPRFAWWLADGAFADRQSRAACRAADGKRATRRLTSGRRRVRLQ